MSEQANSERVHGLDAVRGLALLLGVVLHATMSFLPGPQIWIVADQSRSSFLSVLFFIIHMMRMTAFFLIAGLFGRMVCERIGWRRFAADRLKRIGVPLVVAWPLVMASIGALLAAVASGSGGESSTPLLPAIEPATVPLAHLWFLYVLLLFYAAMLTLRGLITLLDRSGQLRRGIDAAMRALVHAPWAVLILAIPVATALYRHPYWVMWFGVPTPDTGLFPNNAALITYGLSFGLGWLVHRQMTPILQRWQRQWHWYLVVAIAATVTTLLLVGIAPLLMPAPQGTRKLAFAAAYAVGIWSWCFALLGIGLRFLGDYSPIRRYLADASYWIYLAHLPVVMLLQARWSATPWPWQVKLPLILLTTLTLLLVSYRYLIRPSFIGATLNGKRYPRGTARREVPPPQTGTTIMRILPFFLLFPLALAAQNSAPKAPAALSLDSVLARHARALGPLATIQTRRSVVKATGLAPFPLTITIEAMRPNLLRKDVDIQGSHQITGFDGSAAWRIDPFVAGGSKPMDLPAAELEGLLEEVDFDGPLVRPAANGHKVVYGGPEVVDVDGHPRAVHRLELTFKGGSKTTVYIDAATWLEAKRAQIRPVMGRDTPMEIFITDYRVISGVKVPYLMEVAVKGVPTRVRLAVERVEMNPPIDRARFLRARN